MVTRYFRCAPSTYVQRPRHLARFAFSLDGRRVRGGRGGVAGGLIRQKRSFWINLGSEGPAFDGDPRDEGRHAARVIVSQCSARSPTVPMQRWGEERRVFGARHFPEDRTGLPGLAIRCRAMGNTLGRLTLRGR